MPWHFMGATGDARGHDLHAQPAAAGFAVVRLRDFAASIPHGGTGGPARRPSPRRAGGRRGLSRSSVTMSPPRPRHGKCLVPAAPAGRTPDMAADTTAGVVA